MAPSVIAVVVHRGTTGWRGPTTLRELCGAPARFLDEGVFAGAA